CLDRIEVLGAGRGAKRRVEPVARRRMADACTGVDIVVAEALPNELLDEIGFLVRAARGGDAADRPAAILVLEAAELPRDMGKRFFPGRLAPRIGDLLAHQRREDAILVGGIAIGKAALHAGMAVIGLARL